MSDGLPEGLFDEPESESESKPKTRKPKRSRVKAEAKARGGARPGSGRKPTSGVTMKTGIYLRCSGEQKTALHAYIDHLNEERAAAGLPPVDLSTWIRELALKHSGNEDLGMAARARARAEEAASIV